MKIALVSDWFAPRPGGIETQLVALATGLGQRGHDVDVITSTPGAVDGAYYRVRRPVVAMVPGLDLALSPGVRGELRRMLRRGGYDIVHAHISVVSPLGYGALAAGTALSLATVVTFHSVLRAKQRLLALANRLFLLDRRPVQWTAVSTLVAGQVLHSLPRAAVSVLPNGIDLRFWQSCTPGIRSDDEVRFVSAMRLHRKKRPRALLRAFAAARAAGAPQATLTFVGRGPELRALERDAASLDLQDDGCVRFIPWASAGELRAIYAGSDVFVSACEREAFGIAALEARAAGLPVIAMRQAGSSEFLYDNANALLCDDDLMVTTAITRLATDAVLRSRLASASVAFDAYDWPTVLTAHEAAYATAIARAPGARGGPS